MIGSDAQSFARYEQVVENAVSSFKNETADYIRTACDEFAALCQALQRGDIPCFPGIKGLRRHYTVKTCAVLLKSTGIKNPMERAEALVAAIEAEFGFESEPVRELSAA